MPRLRSCLLAVVAVALLTPALVACGTRAAPSSVAALPATQLLARARSQITAHRYLTVRGTVRTDGSAVGLDLSYVGRDADGSVTVDGHLLHLRAVGGGHWFRPSREFWRAQAPGTAREIIALVRGRWIVASPGNIQLARLTGLTRRVFVTKQVLSPSGTVSRGPERQVDGVDCIGVVGGDGTLWVAVDDGRPVRLTSGGDASGTGDVHFIYSRVAVPRRPAAAEVVDLDDLGG